jgi:ATP-dependent DNA helicase RecG
MADLTDLKLIESARKQAQAVFTQDPDLIKPENQSLTEAMDRFWKKSGGDIS